LKEYKEVKRREEKRRAGERKKEIGEKWRRWDT
jgi:hypothetical protein